MFTKSTIQNKYNSKKEQNKNLRSIRIDNGDFCFAFDLFISVQTLFQRKRLTIGTLFFGRIGFVCAYLNFTQGTIILTSCVMAALLNGASDTLINLSCHGFSLLKIISLVVQSLL